MARTTSYKYSAQYLRRIGWWGLILAVAATAVALALAVFLAASHPSDALAYAILGVVLAVLVACFVAWAAMGRYRTALKCRAAVTTTSIELREAGGLRSGSVAFGAMRALWIWRFRSGEVAVLAVRAQYGRALRLSGFEDMDSMARQVLDAAPPDCEIRERRQVIDLGHPLVGMAGIAALCAIILSTWGIARATLGDHAPYGFGAAWYFGIGLTYLILRPWSDTNLGRFSWGDVAWGLFWVILGTIQLVGFILAGG
jgi:cytochrome c oxidase subunit IV